MDKKGRYDSCWFNNQFELSKVRLFYYDLIHIIFILTMDYSSASYDFGRLMSSSKPDVDFESYINATTRGKSGDTGRVDVDRGVAPEVEVVVKVEPSEPDTRHAHNDDVNDVNDDDVEVMFEVSEEYDPQPPCRCLIHHQ